MNSQVIRLFDRAAMGFYPFVARAFGYTFRVGTGQELLQDGRRVLRAVWSEKVALPPPEVASYGERYDRATTWIVAYHRRQPVGVMGLLDMRIASMSLDYKGRLVPPDLDLSTTREIGRLGILREHRGGAQLVMVGLLREMLAWANRDRAGLVFGEGAGIVVLETREHAEARGATILGTVAGYGMTSDGSGAMVAPSSEGAQNAMQRALRHAGLSPDDISYINTHGTSTPSSPIIRRSLSRRIAP